MIAGTGKYTTSTTNMYTKDRCHVPNTLHVGESDGWAGVSNQEVPVPTPPMYLKISTIEERLALILLVIAFNHQLNIKKIQVRINATVQVIRACLFIVWSVLEGTQRVPPTCMIKTSRTSHRSCGWFDLRRYRPGSLAHLKISKIEKNISIDHTRPCIQT